MASENESPNGAHNLGLLYLKGRGVERNLMKAKQYLTLAVNRKDINAMESLAYYYLKVRNIVNAKLWFSRAVNNGCVYAKLYENEFNIYIKRIEDLMQINHIEEWETNNGLNCEGLTIDERLSRMVTHNRSQEEKDIFKDVMNLRLNAQIPGLPSEMTTHFKYDFETVVKYAKTGSIIAIRMETAINYSFRALLALEECKTDSESHLLNILIHNFAKCIRTEYLISSLAINYVMFEKP